MPLRPLPPIHKVLSAGLVVVHEDGARYRLLCLRSFDQWDFPKAEVEDDGGALQAAIDAVDRQTRLVDLAFHWGEEYRETVAFDDGRVSRYYLAETGSSDVVLDVPAGSGAEEDYEYRWLTVDEAEDVLPPRLAIVLDWVVRTLSTGVPRR